MRFLILYIKEAHAEDTWPLGIEHRVTQTHTTENRCSAVNAFLEREPLPKARVLVDEAPGNAFDEWFAAWPLRYYVIDYYKGAHRVSYIGEPHGSQMRVSDLETYLKMRDLL